MSGRKAFLPLIGSGMSVFFFYLCNRYVAAVEGIASGNLVERVNAAFGEVIPSMLARPFFVSTSLLSLAGGMCGVAAVWLLFLHSAGGRKYMPGIEHGSAKWGGASEIAKLVDKDADKNIILTETERLSLSSRMKQTATDDFNRNKHVLVIGGTGSGKTRFYIKPNIMQLHSSYVITDSKGALLRETGKMLVGAGYTVKIFDLVNRDLSDLYNPFEYLRTEDDILKLVTNLITNTSAPQEKKSGGLDFWEKAETALLEAVFGYVLFEARKADRNMGTVMDMLRLAEVKEEDEGYQSPLDIMFAGLEEETPGCFAARQYGIYKLAAGKTAKSILVSVGVRLAPFNIPSIRRLVSGDTIALDMTGSEKTALFVILSDTDKSFNFLAAMMFQQMFDILVYRADNEYGGTLPFHVRCLMDEFANIGQIPQLETLIASVRSRGISLNIILQNLAQIKSLYKHTWETITGNCDSLLFLGGMEQSTLEYISRMCGKTTISSRNTSESHGMNDSHTTQHSAMGRDLITADEAGGMRGRTCILKIRGLSPFRSRKYDIKKHKRYRLLLDAGEQNLFDIKQRGMADSERFLKDIKTVEAVRMQSSRNMKAKEKKNDSSNTH